MCRFFRFFIFLALCGVGFYGIVLGEDNNTTKLRKALVELRNKNVNIDEIKNTVSTLMKNPATDVSAKDKSYTQNALHFATFYLSKFNQLQTHEKDLFNLIVEAAKIKICVNDVIDNNGYNALHAALYDPPSDGYAFEVIKYIVDQLVLAGADINAPVKKPTDNATTPRLDEYYDFSPLLIAAYKCNKDIVQFLLDDKKANITPVKNDSEYFPDYTILHLAMLNKDVEVAKYLLTKDACKKIISNASKHGITPLHLAYISPQKDALVKLLVEANKDAKTKNTATFKHVFGDNDEIKKLLKKTGKSEEDFFNTNIGNLTSAELRKKIQELLPGYLVEQDSLTTTFSLLKAKLLHLTRQLNKK